jgi:hypothetical protein
MLACLLFASQDSPLLLAAATFDHDEYCCFSTTVVGDPGCIDL